MKKTCPLLSGSATRVKNVDGRLLGKDDKQLNMYRRVQLEEPTIILNDSLTGEAFNSLKYCTDNVHESAGNGGMKLVSFASMFKDNTSKKTVHLSKLRNNKCVSGADVSIPLALVDEGMEQVLENGPWLIRRIEFNHYKVRSSHNA
ncbi:hypothetical protein Tco_1167946 [Tanacetum coccineum]